MGFLGDDDEESDNFVEEVSISAPEEKEESGSRNSSDLKKEAEQKFTGRSSGSKDSNSVSLEEVHRQNEKIISMLEDLKEDENDNSNVGGAMDGVL